MKYFREMLSEHGEASSKRFIGFISYIVCLGCIIGLTIKDGGSTTVESLIQTLLITSSGLLGISSVTGIWKDGSTTVNDTKSEKSKKNDTEEE